MSENNDGSSESNSLSSDSTQPTSRRGAPLLRSSVLRPSVLGAASSSLNSASGLTANIASSNTAGNTASSNSNSNTLSSNNGNISTATSSSAHDGVAVAATASNAKKPGNTGMGNNPFMREQRDNDENNHAAQSTGQRAPSGSTSKGASADGDGKKKSDEDDNDNATHSNDDEEPDERPDPLTMLRKNGLERANMFAAAKSSIPRVERSGFVFGQNVHERVVGENISAEGASKASNAESGSTAGDLLFSSVIENAKQANNEAEAASAAAGVGGSAGASSAAGGLAGAGAVGGKELEAKSLTEVAREYEESRAQKRKYEEVETFTGEENEENIVDINCKLFAFVNSNWEERGRGSMRLNDSKSEKCSRVVFRTSGNLRLLLNTKVWAGMVVESPSAKSLRLTAMDNTGKIKIFLLMARPMDVHQLLLSLIVRIDAQRALHATGDSDASDSDGGAVGGAGIGSVGRNGNQSATKNGDGDAVAAAAAAAAAIAPPELEEDAELDSIELEVPPMRTVAAVAAARDTSSVDEAAATLEPSPKKSLFTAEVNN